MEARLLASFEDPSIRTYTDVLERAIDTLLEISSVSVSFQKEVMALHFLDEEVRAFHNGQRQSLIDTVVGQLVKRNIITEHGKEKVFLIANMIEDITREFAYNPGSVLSYETLLSLCKDIVRGFEEAPSPGPS